MDVTFTVMPADASNKTLKVVSSDTGVATVALKNGTTYTVSFVKDGNVTVTASSVSTPSVSVSVTVTVKSGASLADKQAWHDARMKEVDAGTYKPKAIAAGFTVALNGTDWTPFKNRGTDPATMIQGVVKDWDSGDYLALIPGDYYEFNMTVNGTTSKMRYEYTCMDQWLTTGGGPNPDHHALMVSAWCWPNYMQFDSGGSNTYKPSDLHVWEEGTFYNALPKATRDAIKPVSVMCWSSSGTEQQALAEALTTAGIVEATGEDGIRAFSYTEDAMLTLDPDAPTAEQRYDQIVRELNQTEYADVRASGIECKVFSLGEIEWFGKKMYSTEKIVNPGTSAIPNHHIERFDTNAKRIRKLGENGDNYYHWSRAATASNGSRACFVNTDGTSDYSSVGYSYGALSCFCLG